MKGLISKHYIILFIKFFIFLSFNLSTILLGNIITVGTSGQDYTKIQDAIDNANSGDEVIVYQGTYNELINFKGKNIVLRSINPQDSTIVENTIVDGNKMGTCVQFNGMENANCILAGFTITNGSQGAISGFSSSTAIIKYNKITKNQGGGIMGCNGIINNNTISYNSGCGLTYCNGHIQDNTIIWNAEYEGAGLSHCNGIIERNMIAFNNGTNGGGLAYCNNIIQNNIIFWNRASGLNYGKGGGLYKCDGLIQNNTIFRNEVDGTISTLGCGLYDCDGIIKNCIIWDNVGASAHIVQMYDCSFPTYCCIEMWYQLWDGNISENPQLVAPYYVPNRDFHLQEGSPCIDAGCFINDLNEDFEHNPRPIDGTSEQRGDGSDFDMGAYEFKKPTNVNSWSLWE